MRYVHEISIFLLVSLSLTSANAREPVKSNRFKYQYVHPTLLTTTTNTSAMSTAVTAVKEASRHDVVEVEGAMVAVGPNQDCLSDVGCTCDMTKKNLNTA